MLLDTRRAAVIAIDLQRAFCLPDGSVGRQGRDVGPCRAAAGCCIELADAARTAGIPVIWVRMVLRPDYADGGVLMRELRPGLAAAGGLKRGTPDVELIPDIVVDARDDVIDKPRMSAFLGTPLEVMLNSRGINSLIVGGVTTSMCVESTVRDAGQRDYATFVVKEACGDFDQRRHEASLDAMAFCFARVIDKAQALQAIRGQGADL